LKKFYIFKVGETFQNTKDTLGDFDAWVARCVKTKDIDIETIDILKGETLPLLDSTLGVIITGSHAMVTEEHPWSVAVEEWIARAAQKDIGILGICYGHQLIAKALGGTVDYNPKGKEIGSVMILTTPAIQDDPLFCNAPDSFSAHVTHFQSVLKLPANAQILGCNNHDPHQIVRFGKSIWGVQFHPEYTNEIMQAYIQEQKEELESLEFVLSDLISNVVETDYANGIIERFIDVVVSK